MLVQIFKNKIQSHYVRLEGLHELPFNTSMSIKCNLDNHVCSKGHLSRNENSNQSKLKPGRSVNWKQRSIMLQIVPNPLSEAISNSYYVVWNCFIYEKNVEQNTTNIILFSHHIFIITYVSLYCQSLSGSVWKYRQ